MSDLVVANRMADWRKLKSPVLDSVSSPITRRVYNLGLDEFIEWFGLEPRPGFTKATVNAWRGALEARALGSVSINVRITAVRKLAVEAADNGLLAPELAASIACVKGAKSKGVRLGNWLSLRQAQTLLNAPDTITKKGLRDRAMLAILLGCGFATVRGRCPYAGPHPTARQPLVHHRSRWEAWPRSHDSDANLGQGRYRRLDFGR
jgi:site-specific recombinase XerC